MDASDANYAMSTVYASGYGDLRSRRLSSSRGCNLSRLINDRFEHLSPGVKVSKALTNIDLLLCRRYPSSPGMLPRREIEASWCILIWDVTWFVGRRESYTYDPDMGMWEFGVRWFVASVKVTSADGDANGRCSKQ